MAAADCIFTWLETRLEAQAASWLAQQRDAVATGGERALNLALGLVPRKLGRADLKLSTEELAAATSARPGWDPSEWSVDQAARVALLLLAPCEAGQFRERLDRLIATADVAEAVALYRGLPLYPEAETLRERAAEGLRSNMKAVFEAVAHRSPYPCEQFADGTWNHMVLKALFVGSPLWPIQGLDQRCNAELTTMLCDYAHERWAASRTISPELWRCVGPCADDRAITDLARVLRSGTLQEKQAAVLAISSSDHHEAAGLLATVPDLVATADRIEWRELA